MPLAHKKQYKEVIKTFDNYNVSFHIRIKFPTNF